MTLGSPTGETSASRWIGLPARVTHAFDRLRSSYWFIPSVLCITAAGLAFGALEIDRRWIDAESEVGWLYLGSAAGARSVLGAIAGSIVTVAGVVFSITIATLAQASTQFGPRILRKFMRDVGNQVVLGTFVATFLYCLLVLRTVRGQEEGPFVPHLAVALAVLFAVLSIGVLIFFVHHVAASLQAPIVIDGLGADLAQAMSGQRDRAKAIAADGAPSAPTVPASTAPAQPIRAERAGYVQVIDRGDLLAAARDGDLVIEIRCAPGDYALDGSPLAFVRGPERCDADLAARIRNAFLVGPERTSEQDVRFALEQAVEIGVRSLSPGINDPFTAANCIDWLGSALARLGREPESPSHSYDGDAVLRLVEPVPSFPTLVDVAFEQITVAASRTPWVLRHLLDVLALLAEQQTTPDRIAALTARADHIRRIAEREVGDAGDLEAIVRRHARAFGTVTSRTGP